MLKKLISENWFFKKGDGKYLWSIGNTYGNMQYEGDKQTLSVVGDELELSSFQLRDGERAVYVSVDGQAIPFEQRKTEVLFSCVKVRNELILQTER